MRTIQEAIAEVSAPGQPFEVVSVEHDGVTNRVFKNSPTNVRQFFDLSRGLPETFLVYEDEEWSFIRVMAEVDGLANALVHRYDIKKATGLVSPCGTIPSG